MAMPREPGLDAAYWAASAPPAGDYPPLEGSRKADVAIIGGGFTGCSAALHLAQKGLDAVLLEASEIGWGGSGRNTGLVNPAQWMHPNEIERRIGPEFGPRFVETFGKATDLVFAIVERYRIECELTRKGSIRAAHSKAGLGWIEEHARQWSHRGASVEMLDRATLAGMLGTERYRGGFLDHRSASIQPLGYVRGLARAAREEGAAIHCGTPVRTLARDGGQWRVATDKGEVRADSVILATNAYSDDLWPGVRQSTIPVGIFAYCSEPLGENVRGTVMPAGHSLYDTQPAMYHTRLERDGRLMLGSLGCLPPADPEASGSWVNRALRWIFPQVGAVRWTYRWAGTAGFTPEHTHRLHEPAPNLHMALGYNGRGIAPGTLWGRVLAERVMGTPTAELPLPVTPVRPIRFRGLWRLFYETSFRSYRLRRLLD